MCGWHLAKSIVKAPSVPRSVGSSTVIQGMVPDPPNSKDRREPAPGIDFRFAVVEEPVERRCCGRAYC